MGEYTTFECDDCGYKSDKLRWGVSAENPRIRYMAAHCSRCATFTEIELTDHDVLIERFSCPDCGAGVTFFEHIESFECPRCEGRNVRLRQEGYW